MRLFHSARAREIEIFSTQIPATSRSSTASSSSSSASPPNATTVCINQSRPSDYLDVIALLESHSTIDTPIAGIFLVRCEPGTFPKHRQMSDDYSPIRSSISVFNSSWSPACTVTTGIGETRTTFSATLPSRYRSNPVFPRVPMTIRSMSFSRA